MRTIVLFSFRFVHEMVSVLGFYDIPFCCRSHIRANEEWIASEKELLLLLGGSVSVCMGEILVCVYKLSVLVIISVDLVALTMPSYIISTTHKSTEEKAMSVCRRTSALWLFSVHMKNYYEK